MYMCVHSCARDDWVYNFWAALYILVACIFMRMSVLVIQIPAQPRPCFWAYSDKLILETHYSIPAHTVVYMHTHLQVHACILYDAKCRDQKCLRIIGKIVGQKLLWITFCNYISSARLDNSIKWVAHQAVPVIHTVQLVTWWDYTYCIA